MRNPLIWITLASTLGPLLLAGTLFIPVAAALAGVGFQWGHYSESKPGISPGLWICGAAAVVTAFFIYPSHFDAIEKCDGIAAAGATSASALTGIYRSLGLPAPAEAEAEVDEARVQMLEAGCNSLPFYTMPTF